MIEWNPTAYAKFESERTQPSVDLIKRISIRPNSILDIGCGPGNSTNQLAAFFPDADILGIDSSDSMLRTALQTYPNLSFRKCLVPDELDTLTSYDLIFSNACLHWIPEHKTLLPTLLSKLNNNGMLAVQIPMVQNAVFYKTLDCLVSTDRWSKLRSIRNFYNLTPDETYDILASASRKITMWETTYYHIVPSHNSVIDWYEGSGLKPYLSALDPTEKQDFTDDLLGLVKSAYPKHADSSVILKMPRLFFIAVK